MSNTATKHMIELFREEAEPTLFFAKQFRSPRRNFYKGKTVEIDIQRTTERVAITIIDVASGVRWNAADTATNKEFEAPPYVEGVALDSFKLTERMPGRNPFDDPEYRADAIERILWAVKGVWAKIVRAIELQASQVFQTGTVDLIDENGTTLYTIDYSPKVTHFPTAATAWTNALATPIADLAGLARVIRTDGRKPVNIATFGGPSWEAFVSHDSVKDRLDTRRIDLGNVAPTAINGDGATFKGIVDVDNYKLECWSYDGRYDHPQTLVSTPYMADDQVNLRASSGRMDATFGAIPNVGRELGLLPAPIIPSLPNRIMLPGEGVDLHVIVYIEPNGKTLKVEVGCRPLLVPTAIDTIGSLNTAI
jgi:hypothetical protein